MTVSALKKKNCRVTRHAVADMLVGQAQRMEECTALHKSVTLGSTAFDLLATGDTKWLGVHSSGVDELAASKVSQSAWDLLRLALPQYEEVLPPHHRQQTLENGQLPGEFQG